MKIKKLKKSATIHLETREEVEAFAQACEFYMTMVYEEPDDDCSDYGSDDLMLKIDKKFNPSDY